MIRAFQSGAAHQDCGKLSAGCAPMRRTGAMIRAIWAGC